MLFFTLYGYISSLLPLQLTAWYKELKETLDSNEIADSVETAEEALAQFEHQRDITVDASVNTISEGQNLIDQLR